MFYKMNKLAFLPFFPYSSSSLAECGFTALVPFSALSWVCSGLAMANYNNCFLNNSDGSPAGCIFFCVCETCFNCRVHLLMHGHIHSSGWEWNTLRSKKYVAFIDCNLWWRQILISLHSGFFFFFWLIFDPHKLSVSPSMKDINPRGFELLQLQDRVSKTTVLYKSSTNQTASQKEPLHYL